jgi:hypothetical protein
MPCSCSSSRNSRNFIERWRAANPPTECEVAPGHVPIKCHAGPRAARPAHVIVSTMKMRAWRPAVRHGAVGHGNLVGWASRYMDTVHPSDNPAQSERAVRYVNNGSGPERSLCLRNGGASRRISRCREAGRRLGFQPERGGAAHPPFTDWSSQHARKMSVARSGPNDTVAWSSRGMGGLNRPPDNRPNLSLVRAAIVKEQRYG